MNSPTITTRFTLLLDSHRIKWAPAQSLCELPFGLRQATQDVVDPIGDPTLLWIHPMLGSTDGPGRDHGSINDSTLPGSRHAWRAASLNPTVISPYSFPFRDTYTYWADVRFPQLTLPNIQRYELIVDCTCYSIPVPAQHLCVLLDLVTSKRRKKKGICNV